MSNPWCNPGKSSANTCNPELENRQYDLGWFNKLNVKEQEELIRELSTKVQGNISIEKHPSEREEDFKSRHFKQLWNKVSSDSKTRTVGCKVLKAYLRARHSCSQTLHKKNQLHSPPDEHEKPNHKQFAKYSKSIDSRPGTPGRSSLNPELFKIKTLNIRGGRPQDAQGGAAGDQQGEQPINRVNTW